jgi:hypothetical protein
MAYDSRQPSVTSESETDTPSDSHTTEAESSLESRLQTDVLYDMDKGLDEVIGHSATANSRFIPSAESVAQLTTDLISRHDYKFGDIALNLMLRDDLFAD